MKKVTIQSIAKELNLSRNTVAKALSDSSMVAYETRQAVIQKAHEMGYAKLPKEVLAAYNIQAEEEEQKNILVVARKDICIYWNKIVLGISEELNKQNYALQLCFIDDEDEKRLIMPNGIHEKIEGMLVLSIFSNEYVDKLRRLKKPMVFLDMPAAGNDYASFGDVIYCEGVHAVKELVLHLAGQGMTRIGFIGDITYCRTIRERYDGYLAGLSEAGLAADPAIMAVAHKARKYYVTEEVEAAVNAMQELPEAFVCANDDIAFDVIRVLKAKNIRVPEEIAVTGHDNIEEMAQVDATLTTVKMGNQRLGRRLVMQLLFRIENPDFRYETTTISVETVYRASSKKMSPIYDAK